MRYEIQEAKQIAFAAIKAAGASDAVAEALTNAVVSAELAGTSAVGFAHLLDYLDGFVAGRIDKEAVPKISFPAVSAVTIDAKGGIAQYGFDLVFDDLVARVNSNGCAVMTLSNSYTVGELGYYTRRLAEAGLISLAMCNSPAVVTTAESGKAVYGTNPLSFAAPTLGKKPLVIDQATSSTAVVNIMRAAENGESIPEGWALSKSGAPTTDAREASEGLLLAFGGARGANISMITEILSAGLGGGNWSMDAPPFEKGAECPRVSLFLVAISPGFFVDDFQSRLTSQIFRLAERGVRIPGSHIKHQQIDVAPSIMDRVKAYAA